MSPNRRQLALGLLGASPWLATLGAAAQAVEDYGAPENTFISPCGQPFRAKSGAPYPVVDWFHQADKNADGKLDRAEFNADAEAFFRTLDQNRDGFLSPYEVNNYELKIAPEVVGVRVEARRQDRARLWLAQYGGAGGGGMGGRGQEMSPPPSTPSTPPPQGLGESTQGASPYSFFDEPEPVAAADLHYRGVVSKADFLTLSNAHFDTLDRQQRGFLTLDALPQTPIQRQLARLQRHRRR